MLEVHAYLLALVPMLSAATLAWLVSVAKRNAAVVDSLWGPMFALAAVTYAIALDASGARVAWVLGLVGAWALRLSVYITWRNWGDAEDHRYAEIRRRNEPRFWLKSLYLVFGFQVLLAWLISLPLLAAIAGGSAPVGALDVLGVALCAGGLVFETIADRQLARFKRETRNRGQVLDRGLWRYTRHPNYFGECCVWWGFYCLGAAAGGWWAIVSPLLMTFLLLKVSGVALLERSIEERRPGYAEYVRRTSAFLPLPRRKAASRPAISGLE